MANKNYASTNISEMSDSKFKYNQVLPMLNIIKARAESIEEQINLNNRQIREFESNNKRLNEELNKLNRVAKEMGIVFGFEHESIFDLDEIE